MVKRPFPHFREPCLGALLFPPDCAGQVRIYLYVHLEGVFRKKLLYILRPLHKAEVAAVEIVFKPDVDRFRQLVDAVEVEVVDGAPVFCHVFVYDGEGRGAYRVRDPHAVVNVVFPAPIGA